jgi:hypothetical protein
MVIKTCRSDAEVEKVPAVVATQASSGFFDCALRASLRMTKVVADAK